jgi:dTDP-D-glucose 4,6-dehydratase
MKYVVTGAAGFIGSTLCDALLAGGHEVTGVDSFTDYYPRPLKEANLSRARDHANFELLEIDLAAAELNAVMGDTDGVFHLAAQPGVRESWGAEFATYVRDGIMATQRVLEACPSSEQRMRASQFAQRGWVSQLDPDELRPDRLAAAVLAALAPQPASPASSPPDLGGLARAVDRLQANASAALARAPRRDVTLVGKAYLRAAAGEH